MSIHTWKQYEIAYRKRAQAAHSPERWQFLTEMTKRELAELVCHFAALTTDSYDEALGDDCILIDRIREEHAALSRQGMI